MSVNEDILQGLQGSFIRFNLLFMILYILLGFYLHKVITATNLSIRSSGSHHQGILQTDKILTGFLLPEGSQPVG